MNGRFFAGAKIEAYIYDGLERFRKSGKATSAEDDADETSRLDKFGAWLEEEGKGAEEEA